MINLGTVPTADLYRELITRFSDMHFDTAHTSEEVQAASVIKVQLRNQVNMLTDRQYAYRTVK